MKSLKEKNIIIISSIEWNYLWQRHQIFATYFSKFFKKIIFIESSAKRNPKISDIPRIIGRFFKLLKGRGKRKQSSRGLPKNLVIISPFVLPSTFKIFRKINKKIFIPMLKKTIDSENIKSPVVINYLPTSTSLELIKILKPELLIYDCVENFPVFPGVPKDTEKIEKEIINISDLVFTDSDFLFRKIKTFRTDVIKILPGVDFEQFQLADKGPLKRNPEILCFFGGINERRIDFKLIGKIAEARNFKIIMIGPIESKIPSFPSNVIFKGKINYKELPNYIKDCDCFIFPYKINEFTKGIIPAKLFECFATGKPIVTTALPSFNEYKDLIYIANNHEEFLEILKNIQKLENENKYWKRKELSRQNSWESRCEEVLNIISSRLKTLDKNDS